MVNFIGNYRFSHRYSLSLNVVYSTGRPITLPLAVVIPGRCFHLVLFRQESIPDPGLFQNGYFREYGWQSQGEQENT